VDVNADNMAQYQLNVGDTAIKWMTVIGKHISVNYQANDKLLFMLEETKKSFNQGLLLSLLTKISTVDIW